ERICWAIHSLSPFKSPGLDGVYPVLLQRGWDLVKEHIRVIYTACIAFMYVPVRWRTAKAVFIPKPGKKTYDLPKSFRVISLTSFAMKGLEKIVDEWVKSTSLTQNPIHDSQHAYQRGKSTETALLRLLESAQSAIDSGEYALAIFM